MESRLILPFIACYDNFLTKKLLEVVSLDDIRVFSVLVAHQEQVQLSFGHAVCAQIETSEAAIFEIFLRAVSQALSEDAKE